MKHYDGAGRGGEGMRLSVMRTEGSWRRRRMGKGREGEEEGEVEERWRGMHNRRTLTCDTWRRRKRLRGGSH